MNIVSRGGSLVFAWMCMTGEENPFYEYYDEILDICREYDVTISLGDACRPGCLADATDVCQIEELVRLGELTKRAWEKDVQVMVEGPVSYTHLQRVQKRSEVQKIFIKYVRVRAGCRDAYALQQPVFCCINTKNLWKEIFFT